MPAERGGSRRPASRGPHRTHRGAEAAGGGRIRRRYSSEARARMMLEAAGRLFSEHGYHGTSVNELIGVCGGSKATLVRQFGSKAGLFGAVISTYADRIAHELAAAGALTDVRAGLQAVGEALLRFYLSHGALQTYRGVVASGPDEAEVARRFYENGHLRIVRAIAGLLINWRDAALLDCPSPERTADCFTHMLRHGVHEQALIGMQPRVDRGALRRHVRAVVEAFLHGYAS